MAGGRDGGPLRIAIVGLGPKGLFALERLLDHASRLGGAARMDVELFEPHPCPGAGPVYDPAQPDYLRMNFAADRVDVWWPDCACAPARERRSFVAWRGESGAGEAYAPRARVGRYLADAFATLLRHAPPAATITLRPLAVRALERRPGAWRVHAADGFARDYDEVLVTIGHGIAIEPSPVEARAGDAPLVDRVFPVQRQLARERVPAGAGVAVRGFALTFLDAALALTEGRGGRFEAGDPHRLVYVPGDADARVILPFSRTGRPMLAKPDPGLAAGIPALEAISLGANERIRALPGGFALRGDLLAILASAAAAALLAATDRPAGEPLRRAVSSARAWLAAACDGVCPPTPDTPVEEIERSLAVGAGLRRPGLPWALGHTWRSVYPALVERLGAGGMADRDWPGFRRLAGQMERVAFGPPPVNAAKLLALVAAGRVDLTHVAAGRIVGDGAVTAIASARRVDVVVNAVLAAPGVDPAAPGLLARLLADGHARVRDGRRGIEVGRDAGAVGRSGERTPGLSVIGRATEDEVIGNDTLSRAMHQQADRWARRVAGLAAAHAHGAGTHASPAVALRGAVS